MTPYILVLILVSTGQGAPVAIATVPMATEELCERAGLEWDKSTTAPFLIRNSHYHQCMRAQ
jgi:hypothetical protein